MESAVVGTTLGRSTDEVHVVVDVVTGDEGSAYAAPSHDMSESDRTYAISQAEAKIRSFSATQVKMLRKATKKVS